MIEHLRRSLLPLATGVVAGAAGSFLLLCQPFRCAAPAIRSKPGDAAAGLR